MWQLFAFPLCPFSRKVRLALSEKGVAYEIVREHPWDPSDLFGHVNHARRTPALWLEEKNLALADSQAICEYFEETVERSPLILGTAAARAEIRRLVALFDEVLYADVVHPLLHEKMTKRIVLRQPPGGHPPMAGGRAAQPRRFRRGGAIVGRRLSRRAGLERP
jgi:glutathione S-transferase